MNFNDYDNKSPYPTRDQYTTLYAYKAGKLVAKCEPSGDFTKWTATVRGQDDLTIERNFDENAYSDARAAYDEETSLLMENFKRDLYEQEGVTGNPKASKAFEMAWDRGHSSGFYEVGIYFSELVELIK